MVVQVTDESFQKEVLDSSIPVLVDFWAEWCNPCKVLSPIIDEIGKDFIGKIKVAKMNIDQNTKISLELNIKSIPTMMIFKNGKQIAQKIGVFQKNIIVSWVEEFLV